MKNKPVYKADNGKQPSNLAHAVPRQAQLNRTVLNIVFTEVARLGAIIFKK
jgi:hypothetical protein